jgi:hypothetical protein
MIRKLSQAALVVFAAFFGVLRAQTPATGVPPLRTQITFLVVAGAPELKAGYFESTKDRVRVPVTAGASGKSAVMAYEGGANFVLYGPAPSQTGQAALGATAPAGKPSAPAQAKPAAQGAVLARVELPKAPQVLVLLGPRSAQSKTDAGYTAFAIADDWTIFPAGTTRVLNYSGKRLQVQINNQSLPGDAGPGKPLRVAEAGKLENEFKVQILSSEPEGSFPSYSNSIKVRPNQRVTLVALPRSAEGGRGISIVVTRETAPPGTVISPQK